MNFFKSVFAEDPDPMDLKEVEKSASESPKKTSEDDPIQEEIDSNPSPKSSGGSVWSFGGLIKTFASKSETVIEIYRRDLEEFGSGLKKETAAIREAASRAVKELPVSIEVGASVAQESIESVGHVIDDFGSSVWRGTTEIISQSKDALLSSDHESDYSDNQNFRNSKRYSRFEMQVHAIQTDLSTYCEEPYDLDDFNKWKLGFVLEEKAEEIDDLMSGNGVMEGLYAKLVPSAVDDETFWSRYFYRIHKLKQAEDARANLVKRAIAGEDEDLSWDVDEDENNVPKSRVDSSGIEELGKKVSPEYETEEKHIEESLAGSSEVVHREIDEKVGCSEVVHREIDEKAGSSEVFNREIDDKVPVVGSISDNSNDGNVPLEGKEDPSELNRNDSLKKSDEKMLVEEKIEAGESSKDSEFSVVSSQPMSAEEEDLGWDEIEDIDSSDEKKVNVGSSPTRADLRKRLSAADEDEDLNWDIEDDDEPVKP